MTVRTLEDWLRWQETLHPRSIELGLERVRTVAARLHLPDPRPVTLTIAGTNGKGSSAHLAALIYREAGYRVGLYTSPHLLRYNERVRIDGVEATDAELCAAFEAVEQARGECALTYFEFGTLAALWLFREHKVDVQVLEVGLGGRLDAVNLVDADTALITSIGLDHLDWLGPDRESIAREKAGVFRPDRPAIVAEPDPPRSLFDVATAVAAPLRLIGRDFRIHAHDAGFDWQGRAWTLHALPRPGIPGEAQLRNAAGVLAAIEALASRRPVGEDAIRRALPRLSVPGRCELRGNVVLDVAHNHESALVLAQYLASLPTVAPTVLLLGMLADKPHARIWEALAPCVDAAVLVSLPGPRGLAAADLARRLGAVRVDLHCCATMAEALAIARGRAGAKGRIVVTGSFLTVAAAMGELQRHG
ncbi:dihydrofolate synthase / folylpolyglutamate synthase [Fontimonas thermophila]|uniref:Dihydrofolate synthase/folylpolyglutamate synthase n=1 Tax=Fontimonas thermophila TaxID=1076937 RepID=A0A1I2HM64_9GAMM|nr:bifunctional tetrahydrofolate synthase/dihydrofolate synthase [Fontimonas thermophila]SFF31435.1 dihydrofolate synthase / folylpolyglutamate synthase [Fontimonas thermophila]